MHINAKGRPEDRPRRKVFCRQIDRQMYFSSM